MKWSDSGGGEFQQAPVGTFAGRCIRMIDLGTQKSEYQGRASIKRQIIIAFELPTELMTEGDKAGQPFLVSRFYTASLNEKANLRKDLESWRGRAFSEQELMGFDSHNIMGKACMLSLIANEKGKTKISGIMALPKGMQVLPQVNPSIYFSLDEFDIGVFDSLSDGIKNIIMKSPEYIEAIKPKNHGAKGVDLDDDGFISDDIPF